MNKGLALRARRATSCTWAPTTTSRRERSRRSHARSQTRRAPTSCAVPRACSARTATGTSRPPRWCGAECPRARRRGTSRSSSAPACCARVGGFDTRYRIAADYDAYLRLREAGARAGADRRRRSPSSGSAASSSTAPAPPPATTATSASRTERIALVESIVMRKAVLGVWLHALMRCECPAAEPRARTSRSPRRRRPRVLVVSLGQARRRHRVRLPDEQGARGALRRGRDHLDGCREPRALAGAGCAASRGRDVQQRVHDAAVVAGVLAIRGDAHVRASSSVPT